MTEQEMRECIEEYCQEFPDCTGCIFNQDGEWCSDIPPSQLPADQLQGIVDRINGVVPDEPVEVEEPTNDVIKHPNHYCREGAKECIDEMVLLFGKEVVKHFCLCNIWKYRYRSNAKNGQEDIEKSDQYVRIYERLCEDEQPTAYI